MATSTTSSQQDHLHKFRWRYRTTVTRQKFLSGILHFFGEPFPATLDVALLQNRY